MNAPQDKGSTRPQDPIGAGQGRQQDQSTAGQARQQDQSSAGPGQQQGQQRQGKDRVQGEGDYDAARRYDQSAREFAESGQVDEAARNARPTSAEQADELRRAEREGQSHAKGEDPLLNKPGGMPRS